MCQCTPPAGVFRVVLLVEVVGVGVVGEVKVVGVVREKGAIGAVGRVSLAGPYPFPQKCPPPFPILHLQDFTFQPPPGQRLFLL